MSDLADSFMKIFGFKRIASVKGSVIHPVFMVQCEICGDAHPSNAVPYQCETGDGYDD